MSLKLNLIMGARNGAKEAREENDFYESKDMMENNGGITRKVDGEYLNFCCEDCLKEYRSKH